MTLTISEELLTAVKEASGKPVHLTDSETELEYVVIPADLFDVLTAATEGKTLAQTEHINLLVAAGLRADWNDPSMDIYNDLDPRK